MIRTIVRTDKRVVSFDIPENYVGKELEVIAFSKDEGLTEVLTKKKATFDAIAIDTIGFKFNRDEANER
ncbi:hypothetical protein [uncultured Mucilaginibacter sp.]|uniref:hypothetical protein n=1 Tax=uncultured Mucilaginibacter sp. TaxID=797541 RepID=UPI0025F0860D|nr:hypothetical protein [uncultured Mucilaginibacter sp.]